MSISFNTVPANAAASAVFIESENVASSSGNKTIPQKVLLVGTFNAAFKPEPGVVKQIVTLNQARSLYGRGSLIASMAEAFFTNNSGTELYALPLSDADGTAASGTISVQDAVTKSGTLSLYIAGHQVKVSASKGMSASELAAAIQKAVAANQDLPVTAVLEENPAKKGETAPEPTTVKLTAKFKGSAGNFSIARDIVDGDESLEPSGCTVTVSGMAGGSGCPDVAKALSVLRDTFYTLIVLPWNDLDSLRSAASAGDTRASASVKKPVVTIAGFNGSYDADMALVSSLNSPWVSVIPVIASPSPCYEIAAAAAGKIAQSNDAEPGRPCKTLQLAGIRAGAGDNLLYAEKDALVKAGGSYTTRSVGGAVVLGDLVTTYKKNSLDVEDAATSFRYVSTINKMQAKIYSLDNLFLSSPFDRAVIIDDESSSPLEFALSPKAVKGFVIKLIDEVWMPNAWSKNRDQIVRNLKCCINANNPARMDVEIPDIMTSELAIVAGKYSWGFSSAE